MKTRWVEKGSFYAPSPVLNTLTLFFHKQQKTFWVCIGMGIFLTEIQIIPEPLFAAAILIQ
jgi:hypothetical protein